MLRIVCGCVRRQVKGPELDRQLRPHLPVVEDRASDAGGPHDRPKPKITM